MIKRLLLAVGVIGFSLSACESNANPIDDKCPQHVVWGSPQIKSEGNNQYICKTGYALNYNYETKVSYFAVEHLEAINLVKNASRKNDFREDESVPAGHRAVLKDYVGSAYDRGHMAPAGDFGYSNNAMSESFFLTNMMPQVSGNNRGIWKLLEENIRDWAQKRGELYIITGTIYDRSADKVIGNGVKVPSRLYKIVIDAKRVQSISFMLPNEKLDPNSIDQYVVSIADIEKQTGIDFSPHIPPNIRGIESINGVMKDWK